MQYEVMTTILLLALAGFTVYAVLSHRRHRCVHNDPLCRRERPCIACYRELFDGVAFVEQVPGSSRTSRWLGLRRWRKL